MSETVDRLTVYSDYVCPFCYLGRASLEQYRERREEPLELEWHPFDLRRDKRNPDGSIDHSAADGKDDDYFEQAKQNVRRLQAEYDVEMAQELAIEVDSLPAQMASWHVQTEYPDQWEAFDQAIFDAIWIDGRDIGDTDVLADLASNVDLPPNEIRTASEDDALQRELEDRFDRAYRQRITGVPTFVADGNAASGALPPKHLQRLVERS